MLQDHLHCGHYSAQPDIIVLFSLEYSYFRRVVLLQVSVDTRPYSQPQDGSLKKFGLREDKLQNILNSIMNQFYRNMMIYHTEDHPAI
jgi:hypothetical protein